MSESLADTFRWQAFFQHATQPIFLLNRQRRVLFVNRAWEQCTGLTHAEVRGRACRRRAGINDKDDAILSACAPPGEALRGQSCQVRRRAPGGTNWWEIQFMPFMGTDGLIGMLGAIHVLTGAADTPPTLPDKLMALRDRQIARYALDAIDTDTPALTLLHEQARLAAQTRVPTTLVGEAGAGKAWLARAIHALSERRQRYFVCLDAGKIPGDLLGDILFGSRSRQIAFGTVYLRNPAALPQVWQGRLAESLHRHDDADFPRVIVGFRGNPQAEVQAGRVLDDFRCAVSPITIAIPPLRERLGQLPRLIDVFLQRANVLQPHSVLAVSNEAIKVLRSYSWPENLRELQTVLHEVCRRVKGERIELSDLPFHLKNGTTMMERLLPLDTLLEQVEERLITLALKLTQNNQTRAAELLAIWRPRLMRRMEKFGISPHSSVTTGERGGD
jgi:PAS domain S-box-containing protein